MTVPSQPMPMRCRNPGEALVLFSRMGAEHPGQNSVELTEGPGWSGLRRTREHLLSVWAVPVCDLQPEPAPCF